LCITAAVGLFAEAAPVADEELGFFAEPPFAPLPGDSAWEEETDEQAEAQELINFVQGGSTSVSIYEHCSYRGKSRHVGKPMVLDIHTLGLPNDTVSSVKVPKGFCLTLFEHAKFKGRYLKVNGPARIKCLTKYKLAAKRTWNDQVSSLKVSKCKTLTRKQRARNIKKEAKNEVKQAAGSRKATGSDKHIAAGASKLAGLAAISHAALHGTRHNDGKIVEGKASKKSAAKNQAKALGLPSVHPVDDHEDLKKNSRKNSVGKHFIDGNTKHSTKGMTSQDTVVGIHGHLYLGRRRRRIGAGFGRRRAPHKPVVGAMPHFLKKGTAKLGMKKNPKCMHMKLKYKKKFPYCKKLKCYNYILLKHIKKACRKNKKCQGFTFSADADRQVPKGAGNGCIMAPPCRFFGHVSYDYYEKDWTCDKHTHLHVKDLLPKKKGKKKAYPSASKHPKTAMLKERLVKSKEKASKRAKKFRHAHAGHGSGPTHPPPGYSSASHYSHHEYTHSTGYGASHSTYHHHDSADHGYSASHHHSSGTTGYGQVDTHTRVVHIRCAECKSKAYNLCGTMPACSKCAVCRSPATGLPSHLRLKSAVKTALKNAKNRVSQKKLKKHLPQKQAEAVRATAKPLKYGNPKQSKNDPHLKKHGKHKSWGGVRL